MTEDLAPTSGLQIYVCTCTLAITRSAPQTQLYTQRHTEKQDINTCTRKKIHWTLVLSKALEFNTFFFSFSEPIQKPWHTLSVSLQSCYFKSLKSLQQQLQLSTGSPVTEKPCWAALLWCELYERTSATYRLKHRHKVQSWILALPAHHPLWRLSPERPINYKQSLIWINTAIDISKIMFY